MHNHIKAARAHFAFAGFYIALLLALLYMARVIDNGIDWHVPCVVAGLVLAHALIGWGAWYAHNWARLLTLAFAFPALLAVPLGTLVAILLISCCWTAWETRDTSPGLPPVAAAR
ncbi:hypothetical protein [Massilia sp. METH4]|uniref:hypothetical protein n=1 Tax=Massilia sp. METH4 TaxID=3123041 RepID=UPI0030CFCF74